MNNDKKLVAISKDQKQVFLVKSISEQEYKNLLNEQENELSKKQLEKQKQEKEIYNIQNNVGKLFLRDIILAKSIYDNYVNLGLIENDNDFQKMFYDFYFNNGVLSLENAPKEYNAIMEKVGKLQWKRKFGNILF